MNFEQLFEAIEAMDDVYDYFFKDKTTLDLAVNDIKAYRAKNPWIEKYDGKQISSKPSKEQEVVRNHMEKVYGVLFKPAYLDFNRSHITGLMLELDGYNEELGIAFEYNSFFYHGDGSRRVNDEFKAINCKENGIKLIIFNDDDLNDIVKTNNNEWVIS